MKADVVKVIEAAYAAEADDAAWVRAIAEVTAPALDRGLGIVAALYDTSKDRLQVGPVYGLGPIAPAAEEALLLSHEGMDPALVSRLYKQGPYCSCGRHRAGLSVEAYERQPVRTATVKRFGSTFTDAVAVMSGDPDGIGCLVMAPVRESVPVPKRTSELWTRIAAHLGAAVRLRRASPPVPAVDAVLSPTGRVEHAEGVAREKDARDALSSGAARIDRARGPMRRKAPDEAVALWRALVAGRWSLVEHFDHDGRRYLFARRNEAGAVTLDGLTLLERQVLAVAALGHTNKLIAYELGLTPTAVAMRLARAAKKLGVRTRVELIERCARASGRLTEARR